MSTQVLRSRDSQCSGEIERGGGDSAKWGQNPPVSHLCSKRFFNLFYEIDIVQIDSNFI